MTFIISDGKTVIADKRVHTDDYVYEDDPKPKIVLVRDAVLGMAGTMAYQDLMVRWYEEHDCNPDFYPQHINPDHSYEFIVFKQDCAYMYTSACKYPDKYPYPCSFGSGAQGTFVALKLGAKIKDVAKVQAEHHNHCGRTFDELKIPRVKAKSKVAKASRKRNTPASSRTRSNEPNK